MRDVSKVFTKSQLKGICFILRNTKHKYPVKFASIVALLKKQGFLYQNGVVVANPDYIGD